MEFTVSPAYKDRDSSFTIQAINGQYNSFFRAMATSLFYLRTGINLGFGAPLTSDKEEVDPISIHPFPNHYVQECLANWLEFYVGDHINGGVIGSIGKRQMKGDFSKLKNDGDVFPPLEALLNFLEDWYAGCSLSFAKGEIEKDAAARLDETFSSYYEAMEEFLSPNLSSPRTEKAFGVTETTGVDSLVEQANKLFEELKGSPSVFLMERADTADWSKYSAYSSVAASGTVSLAPDVDYYKKSNEMSFPSKVTPIHKTDIAHLFGQDRLYLLLNRDEYGRSSFDVLFSLVGDGPSFRHRGFCKRVTETILYELCPEMEKSQVHSAISVIYPGERVARADAPVPVRRINISSEGPATGKEKTGVIITMGQSDWEMVEDKVDVLSDFLDKHRFIQAGDSDVFVGYPTSSSGNGGWKARYRLHSSASDSSMFTCEETSVSISGKEGSDLSGNLRYLVLFSGLELATLLLDSAEYQTDAVAELLQKSTKGRIPSVFGKTTLEDEIVDLRFRNLVQGGVCTFMFDTDVWNDVQEPLRCIDDFCRYNPCLMLENGEFAIGARHREEETGNDIVIDSIRRVKRSNGRWTLSSNSHDRRVWAKDDIQASSSSTHKGIYLTILQVHLFRNFATPEVKSALESILSVAEPLRYCNDGQEARFLDDMEDLSVILD